MGDTAASRKKWSLWAQSLADEAETIKNLVKSKKPELLFKKNPHLNQEIIKEIKIVFNKIRIGFFDFTGSLKTLTLSFRINFKRGPPLVTI